MGGGGSLRILSATLRLDLLRKLLDYRTSSYDRSEPQAEDREERGRFRKFRGADKETGETL
jgi:hypothetical protein